MAFKINDLRIKGKRNWQWKGDNATYVAKHRWIKKWFGSPNHCEECNKYNEKKYNWANISGKYKRIREDWKQLCIPCHRKYDRWIDKMLNTRIMNQIL